MRVRPGPFLLMAALLPPGCATPGEPRPSASGSTPDDQEFTFLATVAAGSYSHDAAGSPVEGDTSAGLVRLLGETNSESGWGGGVSIEYLASDDDLFADEGFTPTRARAIELSWYLLYRFSDGDRFRMPVRLGPYAQSLELEGQPHTDSAEWSTYGLRAAVAPEVVLARTRDFAFSLCSEVSLGFGGRSDVNVRTPFGEQDYSASALMFGFEFGPSFRFSRFCIGISYVHRGTSMDDSDPKNGILVRGFDSSFDGVALTLGARF